MLETDCRAVTRLQKSRFAPFNANMTMMMMMMMMMMIIIYYYFYYYHPYINEYHKSFYLNHATMTLKEGQCHVKKKKKWGGGGGDTKPLSLIPIAIIPTLEETGLYTFEAGPTSVFVFGGFFLFFCNKLKCFNYTPNYI